MGTIKHRGLVEATERLYRSLLAAAIGFVVGASLWGMAIAPFNGFNDHTTKSLVLGTAQVAIGLVAFSRREALLGLLRRRPALLLVAAAISIAVLWIDGGWRSSYYLASYAAIALAAVVGGLRWSFACAGLLALGYVGGLAINGYSWAELKELNDADSVIANTGGYLIAAFFFAAPVAWLAGYVARINQVLSDSTRGSDAERAATLAAREATNKLTAREIEVVQLIASSASNDDIATTLTISVRTVHRHVENAMKKTGAKKRTGLAVIATQAGLVPGQAFSPDTATEAKMGISLD